MLVDEASRLGWGDLAGKEWGGIRALYRAFVSHDGINNRTAAGRVTVTQLSRHAGMSRRWTTDRLGAMETAGLLELDRGYLEPDGTPHPSWIRVSKEALVQLLATARRIRDEHDRALWVAARARMAKLHSLRALAFAAVRRRKETRERRLRRSLRSEVSAPPSPLRGTTQPADPPPGGRWWDVLDECEHGGRVGQCPMCRNANALGGPRSAGAQHQAG
jgi:hypothetical protein